MGIKSAAVYSEADYGAPYLEMASESYAIGAAPASDSYLNQDVLLDFLGLGWREEIIPKILWRNAAKLLKIVA
ncbi:MAG: biotin carboxylase N-terminal domain-containing protein, partial [Sulfuricaulis sp.]|nr:biotin carboxylase N-terminal domain-containing protein [Sulfuricaulis sp.]